VVDADALEEPTDGEVSRLEAEDLALIDMDHQSPELAAGIYMVSPFDCDLDRLSEILIYRHQEELFDIYNAYERTWTDSGGAFRGGTSDGLDWDITYSADVLITPYDAVAEGGIRRFETEDWGDVLLVRRWMLEPAVFAEGSSYAFSQDYTVRTFWERAPGEVVHLYGMWRQADFGEGLTSNDEYLQRIQLNGLAGLDEDTERLCAAGLPASQ